VAACLPREPKRSEKCPHIRGSHWPALGRLSATAIYAIDEAFAAIRNHNSRVNLKRFVSVNSTPGLNVHQVLRPTSAASLK